MSWNYRVVRHTAPNGENYYGLHEVYYDQHGKAELWCETPTDTGETLEDLISSLRLQLDAAKNARKIGILDAAQMPGRREKKNGE